MKYICLVYHEEKKLDALVGECRVSVEELETGGHHVFSADLQSVRTATTVRNWNGKLSITDGRFAETKEFLGGFTLINARDLNEAIQVASKLPAARPRCIDVRLIKE
jgi:hypothetical protein